MKILIDLFEMLDYGGIVQCCENLYLGLTENGHDVDFVILRPNEREPYTRKSKGPTGSYASVMGGEVNVQSGWYGQKVMSYGSDKRIKEYKRMVREYDLVVHMTPVPKPDKGGYWKKLYQHDVPQVAWIHDANFRDLYPHLVLVADRLQGLIVSNQAGFAATEWLPTPRALMGTPKVVTRDSILRSWEHRHRKAVCAHVWKRWKRMDLAVRAVPFLTNSKTLILGGDGIEGRYMRSKDKCKPSYEGIWDAAVGAEMDYRGLVSHGEVLSLLGKSRVMLDLSYSKKFEALGSHWNSSLMDAYNCGAVPLVTEENMRDNFDAPKKIWEDGRTHIGIPKDADPDDVACLIESTVGMRPSDADKIVANGRKILKKYCDHKKFARMVVSLSGVVNDERQIGMYPELQEGEPPKGFAKQAKKFVEEKAR